MSEPNGILERLNNRSIQRTIMIQEVAALIHEGLRQTLIRNPLVTKEYLKRLENRYKLDILNYCRSKHGWKEKELPLIFTFDIINGKPHIDFSGPLAYEISHEFFRFNTLGNPVSVLTTEKDVEEEERGWEPEEESGFTYGR